MSSVAVVSFGNKHAGVKCPQVKPCVHVTMLHGQTYAADVTEHPAGQLGSTFAAVSLASIPW